MKIILTKNFLSAVVVSTSVLLISMSTHAEIYKWKDAKGVTHYSSQKPVQQKVKAEDIENKIRSAAGKYRAPNAQTSQNPEQSTKNNENGKSKTKLTGPSAKLVSYCKQQRKSLAQLKKNFRNTWKDLDGKTSRLNQKQRQQKVGEIQSSIAKECEGI